MNVDFQSASFQGDSRQVRSQELQIYLLTFLVAACSIIYELIFSQALTVVYGNTVTRYSITIGLYLFCMGLGSFAFRKVPSLSIYRWFLFIELALGLSSILGLVFIFTLGSAAIEQQGSLTAYYLLLSLSHIPVIIIGFLSGLEIPLLSSHLRDREYGFSEVLGVDYLGGLIGTIGYSLFLYPSYGLVATIIITGLFNLLAALIYSVTFRAHIGRALIITCGAITLSFTGLLFFEETISNYLSRQLVTTQVASRLAAQDIKLHDVNLIDQQSTKYQRSTIYEMELSTPSIGPGLLTDTCLNLDGHIQFCDSWVASYHAGLVDIPMGMLNAPAEARVLVLGGGDWIAVNHLRKYGPQVDLVDIDSEFADYTKKHTYFTPHHEHAYKYERLTFYPQDAFHFLRTTDKRYDLIVMDLPGLRHDKLIHLYSSEFYQALRNTLVTNGLFVTWAYQEKRFPEHHQVFMSTLQSAGFRNYFKYFALQENYNDSIIATELFYLLSPNSTPELNFERGEYLQKHKNIYSLVQWHDFSKYSSNRARPSTALHPNRALLVHY